MKSPWIAVTVLLASCATNPPTPSLDERLASWRGQPAASLARTLGEPTSATATRWEWRVVQHDMQVPQTSASLFGSAVAQRPRSASGSMTSPGIDSKSEIRDVDADVAESACAYRALLDGARIVEVIALNLSGRCRFDELPLAPASAAAN